MKIAVRETGLFIRNLSLRVPFRYGIATMTHTPHLVVRVRAEIDGRMQDGFSADNLIPKWFTKNPDSSYAEEIEEMMMVAEHAAGAARDASPASSVFDLWQAMFGEQEAWAHQHRIPPLLASFGVSIIERAVMDAFCRASKKTVGQVARENLLGVSLGQIHEELGGAQPADFLPRESRRSVVVRHTIGMADPLTADDIVEHVEDGLPHTLEEFICAQRLTHFKIKLSGHVENDLARLHRIARVLERDVRNCAFTLDGNESFRTVAPFRELWEAFLADSALAHFLRGLIFVEQPFHRDVALQEATAAELLTWNERPPIIIDESDAQLDSLRVALAGGYAGTSHKNCKGVIHGLANACLIAHRRANSPRPLHLSAEDLTNLGPVALLQDLAVVAALGIGHVERNGHHYFAGLSQFPGAIQREILRCHGDLYARHAKGFPTLRIEGGTLEIGSLVDAPFGVAFEPDLTDFTPRADWRYEMLQSCVTG